MFKYKPEHDIVALYLQKFEGRGIGFSVDEIGAKLGMGGGSLKMRIGNFVAIDAAGGRSLPKAQRKDLPGLWKYAEQSAEVYRKYGDRPEAEIRRLVVDYLATVG